MDASQTAAARSWCSRWHWSSTGVSLAVAVAAAVSVQGCRVPTDSPAQLRAPGNPLLDRHVAAAQQPPGTWAFNLNGTSDFVSVPYAAEFNGTGLTIEAWVRLAKDVTGSCNQARVANRQTTGGGQESWGLEILAPGCGPYLANEVVFHSGNCSAAVQLNTGFSLQANRWYHLAATNDGLFLRVFVDGSEVASRLGASPPCSTNTSDLVIGRTAPYPQFYFPGLIDEVRMWNYARSGLEISLYMNRMISPSGGLVGYWRAEEGGGTVAIDGGGGPRNDGTLNGGVTYLALDPCQPLPPLPPGAVPSDYAACGTGQLQRDEASPVATGNSVAIVLVHGWSPGVGGWRDYYEEQGLDCWDLSGNPLTPCQMPTKKSGGLPGKRYFTDLRRELRLSFPTAPLYFFSYESFDPVADNAADLATALSNEEAGLSGLRFVVVAHSMGGLVARSAVRVLELGGTSPVLAIMTLGTLHHGTPLGIDGNSYDTDPFTVGNRGIPTRGGLDLAKDWPRLESTSLYSFAGNIEFDAVRAPYGPAWKILKKRYSTPDNDGVVPVGSALPGFGSGTVDHPAYLHYDHTELRKGEDDYTSLPFHQQPIYLQLVSDLRLYVP